MLYFTRIKGEQLLEDVIMAIQEHKMPFIILYGSSGSGKSYTSQELCDRLGLRIVRYHVVTTKPVGRSDHGPVPSISSCKVPKHGTALNRVSSRAHLLVVTDKCFMLDPCGAESASTLSIGRCDPGWSQMQRINQDLLALRRFIDSMQGADHERPIPWRESELNKLLYEYKLHLRNIVCIGCLNGSVSDTNTISFLKSIGYIDQRPQIVGAAEVPSLDLSEYLDWINSLQEKISSLI